MSKRIIKKTAPLNVLVDADLLEKANKKRTKTWVAILEEVLAIVAAKGKL